jgi:hypothetical protein
MSPVFRAPAAEGDEDALRGEVAANGPNCLTPRQKADGYVLTCLGHPLSTVTLDIAEPDGR